MKKYIFPLLIAIFTAIQTFAYDFSVKSPNGQTLYYNIINQEQKQVELVSEYTGNDRYETPPAGDLIITSEVEFEGETYSVISIQESCFRYCTKITSVIVEEGIKRIGNDAFGNCSKIKSIVLPNSLEELDYPFVFCTSLQSITLSNSLTTICDGLFWGCESLESVEIPNSVTSMGTSVFYICTNLKSVTLPEGLTKIKQSTFAQCNNLSSINIPSTVTSIGMEAFLECENLTSIVIPASVQDIDVSAFINCENLQTVVIESKTPPSLGENAFPRNENLKIYVPCDAIDDYLGNEDWMPYKSMITSAAHKVFVKSSNNEYGYVTIEEKNACSEEHTAIITAYSKDDDNYQFNHWDDDNKENPRTITVTEDISFTAIFGKKPKILNLETTNPICTSATGSASFDVTNGVSPYTVLWNDGNTDNPRSEMTPGKYYFVATDAEGYTSDTTYVTLSPIEDNMPQISLDPTDPICETENGTITATVSEGTEPYTYNWGKTKIKESTFENFEDGIINNQFYLWEINVENGDYYMVDIPIENSGAASSEQAIHVQGNENDNVIYLLQLYLSDELSLNHATSNSYGVSFYHKGSSAEFNISIDGYESNGNFTIPYHSDWTKVDLSWQEMNIAPYQIPYISEIYWNINTNPDFWIDELSILAYDDDAESFSSEKEVQNLAAGQYMFSVTDSYGCKTIATTSLNKDYSVVPSIELNSSNPICETENGTITATVGEGAEPYTYKWSDGATDKNRENLAEGEYTLTATDAYGCATSETAILEKDYNVLPKFSFDIKNPICETKNGEITTTVTSGTEPYSYTWSTIQPELFSNFEEGLTNKISSNFIIFNDADYGGTTNTDASGITDDGALGTEHSIIIKASSISNNLMGDYAGFYTDLGVFDISHLIGGISFYHKGAEIEFRATGENMFTRSIPKHEDWTLLTYYFDEGFAPKDFFWSYRGADENQSSMQFQIDEINLLMKHSSDITTKDQNELSAGTYKLKVTDSYGCTYTDKVELVKDESNKPVLTKEFKNAICGHDVGEITISYEKGNEPVEYSWEDGSTDLKRENLAEGTYTFTITDYYGCTITDETEIKYESFKYQPELALVSVSQEQSPYNLIIWQKETSEAIDYYTIYRETERLGEYVKLDDVQYNETSIYVDVTANSLEFPYRYKISATDNCGNQSELSPSHKTIHLQKNKSIGTENNLSWTAYEGFDFLTYSIFRVTKDGVEEIKKVNSSVLTYTDLQPAPGTISYYVGVELPETIDINDPFVKAESGPFNLAISNIAEVENKTAISFVEEKPVNVYAAHNAIVVENAEENQIVICNAIGQTIVRAKGENEAVKSFNVENGIYIVIVGNKAVKVVVE